MSRTRTLFVALAIATVLLIPAAPATANPVGTVSYVDLHNQPINTWINVTFNIPGNPPAWNCWQIVQFGNNAGSAYVRIAYVSGYCSDNTGLAFTEQRHPSQAIVRNPATGVCTTWNGAGCVQLPDGSWFWQIGGSSSIISGEFRLCQNNAFGTDTCRQYRVYWS